MLKNSLIMAISLVAGVAHAGIDVRFVEGAPKDRFRVINASSNCDTGPMRVTIDLAGSAGALIFDVTDAGAGVEVFQPFELVTGEAAVSAFSPVKDGDTALMLDLSAFPGGAEVAFTIDVDDTIGAREITVTGSEIAGATVTLSANGQSVSGKFDDTAKTSVVWPGCDA